MKWKSQVNAIIEQVLPAFLLLQLATLLEATKLKCFTGTLRDLL